MEESMDELKSKIYTIISDEFAVPENEIKDDTGPGQLSGWDSIGQLKLIARLEKEFDIDLSVDEVISMNRVSDIVSIIGKHKKSASAQSSGLEREKHVQNVGESALLAPKRLFWGLGSIKMLSKAEFSKISKMAVVVGGSYSKKAREDLENELACSVHFVDKAPGEPTERSIRGVLNNIIKISPDMIVAIGGGSVIDTAKLSWALYENQDKFLDDFSGAFSVPKLRKRSGFIAVPTTFGSGSEASSSAVYSDPDGNKRIVVSHELIPDVAVLDPLLGKTAPMKVIYSSAFDALTHAIEGFVSLGSNPLAEPYAVYAAKNIIEALDSVAEDGLSDMSLERLCYSAHYAGIVQNNCSVGLTHSIAHQLGRFGVPHGLANAITLLPVIDFNSKNTKKLEMLSRHCAYGDLKSMTNKIKDVYLKTINKYGLEESLLLKIKDSKRDIARGAMADITIRTNPVKVGVGDIENIIEEL